MEALCCRMSLRQAALPLLQELKRGVAPSVDTAIALRMMFVRKCIQTNGVYLIYLFMHVTQTYTNAQTEQTHETTNN